MLWPGLLGWTEGVTPKRAMRLCPFTPGCFHSICGGEKAPSARRREGKRWAGRRPQLRERKESHSGVEGGGQGSPRTQEALGIGDGTQLPARPCGPQLLESRNEIWVPWGRSKREQRDGGGRLSAQVHPGRRVADRPAQASRTAGHLQPSPRQPSCARETEARPRPPRPAASLPAPAARVPGPTAPLTTETWRPGPRRRRSGARGSQLWAPRARGRRAGGDEERDRDRGGRGRAGAEVRPRPRRGSPLPRGRRRGPQGRRRPRYVNPFGAPPALHPRDRGAQRGGAVKDPFSGGGIRAPAAPGAAYGHSAGA